MKTLKLILVLIGSVLLQIILFPFRLIKFIFSFLEKLFRILKSSTHHLIKEIENEVIQ